MTWDVLFLLPSMWTGPVLAPVITSLSMILLAVAIWYYSDKLESCRILFREWCLLLGGSLVMIYGFMLEFNQYVFARYTLSDVLSGLSGNEINALSSGFIPHSFPWAWFVCGQGIILIAIVLYFLRCRETVADYRILPGNKSQTKSDRDS